jgi:elongation factor G
VIDQIRRKLRIPAAALQIPIGSEEALEGLIDLVRMKSIRHAGSQGYVPLPV